MRILLVEDDRMIAEGVRKALRGEGFAVDWVEDGEAAVNAAAAQPYDLVLLDLGLPDLGGYEALRMIRAVSAVPDLVAHLGWQIEVGNADPQRGCCEIAGG